MRRGEIIFLTVSVLLIVGFTISGYLLDYPPEAMTFPLIVAVCLVAFTVMRVLEAQREAKAQPLAAAGAPAVEVDRPDEDSEAVRLVTLVGPILWIASIILVVQVFGFLIGLPLYVLAFLLYRRTGLVTSLAVAAATGVFVYVIFIMMLQVLLPSGWIMSFFS